MSLQIGPNGIDVPYFEMSVSIPAGFEFDLGLTTYSTIGVETEPESPCYSQVKTAAVVCYENGETKIVKFVSPILLCKITAVSQGPINSIPAQKVGNIVSIGSSIVAAIIVKKCKVSFSLPNA